MDDDDFDVSNSAMSRTTFSDYRHSYPAVGWCRGVRSSLWL